MLGAGVWGKRGGKKEWVQDRPEPIEKTTLI